MKYLISAIILIFINLNLALGQINDHFVVFCSKESSYNTLGHAFIMTGKGDPFTCSIDNGDGQAFGLYAADSDLKGICKPRGFNAAMSYFVGSLRGCFFNDISTNVSNYFVVRCSLLEYLKVLRIINEWKDSQYELKSRDCLSFVISVANLFSDRIVIPSRSNLENFPNVFISQLKKYNQ